VAKTFSEQLHFIKSSSSIPVTETIVKAHRGPRQTWWEFKNGS